MMADIIIFDADGVAILSDKQSIDTKVEQFLFNDAVYLIKLVHPDRVNYLTICAAIEELKPEPIKQTVWELWQSKHGCSPTVLASFQSYPTIKQLVEEYGIDLLIAGSLARNKQYCDSEGLLELLQSTVRLKHP